MRLEPGVITPGYFIDPAPRDRAAGARERQVEVTGIGRCARQPRRFRPPAEPPTGASVSAIMYTGTARHRKAGCGPEAVDYRRPEEAMKTQPD